MGGLVISCIRYCRFIYLFITSLPLKKTRSSSGADRGSGSRRPMVVRTPLPCLSPPPITGQVSSQDVTPPLGKCHPSITAWMLSLPTLTCHQPPHGWCHPPHLTCHQPPSRCTVMVTVYLFFCVYVYTQSIACGLRCHVCVAVENYCIALPDSSVSEIQCESLPSQTGGCVDEANRNWLQFSRLTLVQGWENSI